MKEINLNHICKIEGHASLDLKIENNKVRVCELRALEGARFFEALVINKKLEDIQEIVSRICGICSCSHSVAAIISLEECLKINPTEQQMIIRELLMIGERIRSHTTHLYFLVLPDYYGAESILQIKDENKDKIDDALTLIRVGNKIVETFGGREMHPFLKIKEKKEPFDKRPILEELKNSKRIALRAIELFSNLKYPVLEREVEYVSLESGDYVTFSNRIITKNEILSDKDYKKHLTENIKEYSTSKFVLKNNKPYVLGAISRVNNNYEKFDKETKNKLKEILSRLNLKLPFKNPFYNNICQAIELLGSINKAIELIEKLSFKEEQQSFKIKEGEGVSAVEAPRGTLFHEYRINKEGVITYCDIITPTCQNLNMMERDIVQLVNQLLEKKIKKETIIKQIEMLIRSYDPCFSCSTHFLKVNWS